MGHKVAMYENLLDMLDREIGMIEKKGELDEKSLDNLFKLTTSVKAVEKRIEKEEEKEQEKEKGSSGGTSYARGRRSRDSYRESMENRSMLRPGWMYEGSYERGNSNEGSYDNYGQSNRRSYESRERGGSNRRSNERGYARDAAKEMILQKLEMLADESMSERERMAIEECIGKLED